MTTPALLAKKAVFITAFFIGLLLFAGGCNKTPDEEQIQLLIKEIIAAVESGKPAEINQHLHADFQANGQMDAQQVKQLLLMYGMQQSTLSITLLSSKTTLDPVYHDRAESLMSLVVTSSRGRGLPDDGSARTVRLSWLKDDDWKLLKAEWE